MKLFELKDNWLQKCDDFRPSAFWFWNGNMNTARMTEVVEEMAKANIREFLIHPVHGMEVEYLSEEYFEKYRFALKLAKKHNMKVWVYDEFGWPTGAAGGLFLRKYPEHKMWYLAFSKDENGNVECHPEQVERIQDNVVGSPWTKGEGGYLDTLSDEAVKCFIDMTYERTRVECGDLFSLIRGYFTDEPSCLMNNNSNHPHYWNTIGMPWSPKFPAKFKEMHGYDVEPHYLELADDNPSKLKDDYWATVKEMFVNAYYKQIGDWCEDHGVYLTGHAGEDAAITQIRYSGDLWQCMKHMQEPGIDHLCWGSGAEGEPDHRFFDHVIIPSMARHLGRKRVYCEAFGVGDFNLRLGEMLKKTYQMGINGINDIALMGFQQSLDGIRKHLYWPPLFMEAPWWDYFGVYRDGTARSVGLTHFGERKHKYAVMFPQKHLQDASMFLLTGNDIASKFIISIGKTIYEAGETFEYVFGDMLKDAKVENGKIKFPYAEYDAVIMPSDITYFDFELEDAKALISKGANILNKSQKQVEKIIKDKQPSIINTLNIYPLPEFLRVYKFDFEDGQLFAVRNSSNEIFDVNISSKVGGFLSLWDPITGDIFDINNNFKKELTGFDTLFITLTKDKLSDIPYEEFKISDEIKNKWTAKACPENMVRPSKLKFEHKEKGWMKPVDSLILHHFHDYKKPTGLPKDFYGYTHIPFKAEFDILNKDHSLGVLFEKDHLDKLFINNKEVNLDNLTSMPIWDQSCVKVSINEYLKKGKNHISGVLKFPEFQTTVRNENFLGLNYVMPCADIAVCGNFMYLEDKIDTSKNTIKIPCDFKTDGYQDLDGKLILEADVNFKNPTKGIKIDLIDLECVEVLVDNKSIGVNIINPYIYKADISAGVHNVKIIITSNSANILTQPRSWGIKSIHTLKK